MFWKYRTTFRLFQISSWWQNLYINERPHVIPGSVHIFILIQILSYLNKVDFGIIERKYIFVPVKIRFVQNIEPLVFSWFHRGWTRMFVNIHNLESIFFFLKIFLNHFVIFIIIFSHTHWSSFNSSVKWKRKHYWVKNF